MQEYLNILLAQELSPLWALPVIGALIGWFTNYLAVKMLFHPREPVRLLFFSLQGVFPKRQQAFAHKLGQIVSSELISVSDITATLSKKATSDENMELVADRIERVLVERLPTVMPMASMFLSPELIQTVKSAFIGDLREMVSELVEKLAGELEDELDVHEIVEEKVANFSSDKLEEILFAIMKREFRFIEFVGAVLGFLIGLAQLGWIQYSGVVV